MTGKSFAELLADLHTVNRLLDELERTLIQVRENIEVRPCATH
jgi:hypothetical protein